MSDYSMGVEILGANELLAALSKAPEIVNRELSTGLNTSAKGLRDLSANNAPYKTGNLKGSIHEEYSSPNNLEAKVGTNIKYGRRQEFGYPAYTITVVNKKCLANRRTGQIFGRSANIPATRGKFFMKRATESYKRTHDNNMKEAMSKIISLLSF